MCEKGGVIWLVSSVVLSNHLHAKEPPGERRHPGVAKLARIINCKATLYLVVPVSHRLIKHADSRPS